MDKRKQIKANLLVYAPYFAFVEEYTGLSNLRFWLFI